MVAALDRDELLANTSLVGAVFCRAYSRRVDEWLAAMFDELATDPDGVALAAVGGYGRSELSPQSDIDVMLLHDRGIQVDDVANALWYPIWDEGLKLGHSVRTPREAISLASSDLETATSLLSLRRLAGDTGIVRKLSDAASTQWTRKSKRWLPLLAERSAIRHREFGELAFLLEPDLKEARGGLRDAHALGWLLAAEAGLAAEERQAAAQAYETLLAARVELHRSTGRTSNVLLLEEQDAVAAALAYDDADLLMADIAEAARVIAWTSDEAWRTVGTQRRRWRRPPSVRIAAEGVGVHGDAVVLVGSVDMTDPLLVFRVAELAARADLTMPRALLERLAAESAPIPEPWPPEARHLFEQMLLCGHKAINVLESLDHFGLLSRLIPEWEPCRSRPQRNAYHRFTVDRHLMETAAQASLVVDRVDEPGLLVIGALLHDIGKGYPGDHTEVGVEMIPVIATRMGYSPDETELLVEMCRHHLLLPDVATRRDIDDPSTVGWVAHQISSATALQLLDGLTEADSIATGPAAWSRWKAGLVRDLVRRTRLVLESGEAAISAAFPTDEQRALMLVGERRVVVNDDCITVVMPDVYASLWRVAGTLALHGLDVLQADVHSEEAMALEVYRVESMFGSIDEAALGTDIWEALDGRIPILERLDERVRVYESSSKAVSPQPVEIARVSFDNESSATATVVEVAAADSLGLLCRLAHALSEQELDITRSKVQTLGEQAVDSFYVRDLAGHKITDAGAIGAIRAGVLHSLGQPEPAT